MHVPLLDLGAQHAALRAELEAAVARVGSSGQFVLGPEVEAFEAEAAAFLGVAGAVGVSSGSDALVCALLASGVGDGDEVLTTSFSFFATAESILRVGATPRFVDIRPDTYELDYEAVERCVGPRTRAILAVHLFGMPARVDLLREPAARRGLRLIEDAAQAFGAVLNDRSVGAFGDLGCFSFQPTKPLGGWGDSGLVVGNDLELLARCRQLRLHGATGKHCHVSIGGNYRMDAVQAAVLRVKLKVLPEWLHARRAHARAYSDALAGVGGLETPAAIPQASWSAALYTVRVAAGRRDALRHFLADQGIESAVHYPRALPRQPALELLLRGRSEEVPHADAAAREVLSLPLFPELTVEQRSHVVSSVRRFFSGD